MPPVDSQLLSRTSSASSVCSDDSANSGDTALSLGPADVIVDGPKRTRKRFTTMQLMMLEHLYHKASHPTREQREQLAKDAEIDVRSVTVWFQNKRQTDRRMHRQLSEPATMPLHLQSCSSPAPSSSLPPSSPFSDASGKTIHSVRARTRTLSSASIASCLSTTSLASAGSRKRERESTDPSHDRRSVRHKPSRHLSLDAIAARTERPVLLPRTPPQHLASSSSPARPRTPEPVSEDSKCGSSDAGSGSRALWENMQSSPAAPDPAPRSEKDILRYGTRKYTLEYACAREMVGAKGKASGREKKHVRSKDTKHRKEKDTTTSAGEEGTDVRTRGSREEQDEDDQEIPVLEWDADLHGDTDTEGVPSEAVTPSSSFGIGELCVTDEQEKENQGAVAESAGNEKTQGARDEELMDVAYVLCGLSQGR
ncbi:hypothetical protein BV20DRAFT_966724 [Pilatotrama ljubarskyi]|nr:hypothetical protein BV20DRAFT_966724 [Pilatotrama ljubarskyi]